MTFKMQSGGAESFSHECGRLPQEDKEMKLNENPQI